MTCGDCKYYQVDEKKLTKGYCRYAPPVNFALPTQQGIMIQAFDPGVGNERLACHHMVLRLEKVN